MAHNFEYTCGDLCVSAKEPVPVATLNEEDKLRILFLQLNDLKSILCLEHSRATFFAHIPVSPMELGSGT